MEEGDQLFLALLLEGDAVDGQGRRLDGVLDRHQAERLVHDVVEQRAECHDPYERERLKEEVPEPPQSVARPDPVAHGVALGQEAGGRRVPVGRLSDQSYTSRNRSTTRRLMTFRVRVVRNSIKPMAKMLL